MSDDEEIGRLVQAEGLPPDFFEVTQSFYRCVVEDIAAHHKMAGRAIVAGICGPQGSGKSTMAAFVRLLLRSSGLDVALLSIDDLYLTRSERKRLARDTHPLLVTRGPPGTHDLELGNLVLDRLVNASIDSETLLPRFDKATDERFPMTDWEHHRGAPDVILLEGWCVGARPQAPAELAAPVNDLERREDPHGTWRNYVNEKLAGEYQTFFSRVDHLTLLQAPSFDCVLAWRSLQEDKLRARMGSLGRALSAGEIARFVQHYERLTRHILVEMPRRADIVIEIDARHRLTSLSARGRR